MDAFNERIARLAELSVDELKALVDEMVSAFDAADASGDLEQMQQIADALDQARSELASKSAEETEPAADAEPVAPTAEEVPLAASVETVAPPVTEDAAPASAEPVAEAPEAEAPAVEAPAEETPAEEVPAAEEAPAAEAAAPADEALAEPAAAVEEAPAEEAPAPAEAPAPEAAADAVTNESGAEAPEEENPVDELTADEVPAENQPSDAVAPPVVIRAGGDIPGVTAGSELRDMDEVVEMLTRKVNSMRNVSGDGEQITVASLRTEEAPDDSHVLRPGDVQGNSRKIRALLSDREQLTPEALTAAAWCAPRAPIYDIPTVGITDRPVAGALPTFNADRGGITWMEPPALPDLTPAIGLWTYDENDHRWESRTNPDGSGTSALTKPSLAVPCGTEVYADVEAVTQFLCFDNMTARAFPEWIRGNTDLTLVAQARFAEQHLLARMFEKIDESDCGTPSTVLGAARDFLTTVKTSAASLRWRFRLGAEAPLQLFAPSWVREAISVDLNIQAPGDDTLTTTYQEIQGYLSNANIDVTWFIDDAPGQDAFDSCEGFPVESHWLLFPTGSFVRLDNGTLDLGVVRSKEDVQKNTYCQFVETFETAVYMGPAEPNQWAIHGVTPIAIQGNTGGPVDTAAGS